MSVRPDCRLWVHRRNADGSSFQLLEVVIEMEISQLFQFWSIGIGGGAMAYILLSLLGAGIHKALSILNS